MTGKVAEALVNGLTVSAQEIRDYNKALDFTADAFIADSAFAWMSGRLEELRTVALKASDFAKTKGEVGAMPLEDVALVTTKCAEIIRDIDTCISRADAPRKALAAGGQWPSSWSTETMDIVRKYGEAPAGPILQGMKKLEQRWPWLKVKPGLEQYCEAGKLQYGIGPFVRDVEYWCGNGHQKRRAGDGCELAAKAVPDVIVSRIEIRRRIAEGTERLPGESLQDHLRRIEDKLRELEAP